MKQAILLFLTLCLYACTPITKPSEQLPTPSEQPSDTLFNEINETLDPFLNDGSSLPSQTKDGSQIQWAVTNGHATITDNKIQKTSEANEYEPISLQATIQNQNYDFDHLMLLDPYVGYIISYFSETGDEKETMKLAYTYNGLYWFKLYEDKAVLTPTIGTKRLRDPSIVRKKDGTFAILATQGYDTDAIYVYDSKDLIEYTNERLLQVNAKSNQNNLSGKQAWAPEAFYDRVLDQYVIYWSSVADGGMFYNLSPDLVSFSHAKSLFNISYPVIDGTITKIGSTYSIIFKDEREPMEEHSQLLKGYSTNHWYEFDHFSAPFTGHQSEGPMVMKSLEYDAYFVFYDDYTRYQFKAFEAKDLKDAPLQEINEKEILIPLESPAHSYAIPVTWKELERLLEAFGG